LTASVDDKGGGRYPLVSLVARFWKLSSNEEKVHINSKSRLLETSDNVFISDVQEKFLLSIDHPWYSLTCFLQSFIAKNVLSTLAIATGNNNITNFRSS